MTNPVDRVAEAAQNVRPLRVLLSILAAPFYVLGYLTGVLVVGIMWVIAGIQVGWHDAHRRRNTTNTEGPS